MFSEKRVLKYGSLTVLLLCVTFRKCTGTASEPNEEQIFLARFGLWRTFAKILICEARPRRITRRKTVHETCRVCHTLGWFQRQSRPR
jgi:hypothetical protein